MSSHTSLKMCAGLAHQPYMRWRFLRHQTRSFVTVVSSLTTMPQAMTLQQQWLGWRGSNTLSVVGGGGTRQQGCTFKLVNILPRTLPPVWPFKVTLGGHQKMNGYPVMHLIFHTCTSSLFADSRLNNQHPTSQSTS